MATKRNQLWKSPPGVLELFCWEKQKCETISTWLDQLSVWRPRYIVLRSSVQEQKTSLVQLVKWRENLLKDKKMFKDKSREKIELLFYIVCLLFITKKYKNLNQQKSVFEQNVPFLLRKVVWKIELLGKKFTACYYVDEIKIVIKFIVNIKQFITVHWMVDKEIKWYILAFWPYKCKIYTLCLYLIRICIL